MVEIYEIKNNAAPLIMDALFETRNSTYNLIFCDKK